MTLQGADNTGGIAGGVTGDLLRDDGAGVRLVASDITGVITSGRHEPLESNGHARSPVVPRPLLPSAPDREALGARWRNGHFAGVAAMAAARSAPHGYESGERAPRDMHIGGKNFPPGVAGAGARVLLGEELCDRGL